LLTCHDAATVADPEVRLADLDPSRHRTDARRSIADRWREASAVAVTRFVIAPVVGPSGLRHQLRWPVPARI